MLRKIQIPSRDQQPHDVHIAPHDALQLVPLKSAQAQRPLGSVTDTVLCFTSRHTW